MADLLFVTRWAPHPQGSGVQQRTFHFLRAFASGYEVYLLVTGDRMIPHPAVADCCRQIEILSPTKWEDPAYLWRIALWTLAGVVPLPILTVPSDWQDATPKRFRMSRKLFPGRDFQVIHASRLHSTPFAWDFKQKCPSATLQLDLDETESRTRSRIVRAMEASGKGRECWRLSADVRCCQEMEKTWLPRFSRIFVSSEREAAFLRREYLCPEPCLIPNIVQQREAPLPLNPPGTVPTLLFVGSFGYFPNRDGMTFFLEDVWPRLLRLVSGEIQLLIVGRGITEEFHSWLGGHSGIRVIGEVADLSPWYLKADLVIAPLRAGGGTRVKILEAFAFGRPVVATAMGADGLAVRHEEHLLLADTPLEMAESCLRILEDKNLASRLTRQARNLVREKYSFPALKKALLP